MNNTDILTIFENLYNLSDDELNKFELENNENESYNNSTIWNYIKEKYLINKCSTIKNYENIDEKGIYIFSIVVTTKMYPDLPIHYQFCYVHDNKPYLITKYNQSLTKMHCVHDINNLLKNIEFDAEKKLIELFRPDYFEQNYFEDVIKVNEITYEYYNF